MSVTASSKGTPSPEATKRLCTSPNECPTFARSSGLRTSLGMKTRTADSASRASNGTVMTAIVVADPSPGGRGFKATGASPASASSSTTRTTTSTTCCKSSFFAVSAAENASPGRGLRGAAATTPQPKSIAGAAPRRTSSSSATKASNAVGSQDRGALTRTRRPGWSQGRRCKGFCSTALHSARLRSSSRRRSTWRRVAASSVASPRSMASAAPCKRSASKTRAGASASCWYWWNELRTKKSGSAPSTRRRLRSML
mmetsp:Transcript_20279/g.68723  ORF Transcript_20279/g.68723 Transcript_20279/m.68723 type:complete len:256 (+) Transcript_20279:843-1610(+)